MCASWRWTLLLISLGACGVDSGRVNDSVLLLASADTILDPSDGQVAKPVDVAVDRNGRVYVTDLGSADVAVFDSVGTLLGRIGRQGSGPGEMISPRSLSTYGDTLRVLDYGSDKIHVFTMSGAFVRSFGGLPMIAVAEAAFNASGNGLLARHGFREVLAQRFAPSGALGATLGVATTPSVLGYDFVQGKANLIAGVIPPALRSYTSPVLGADGTAWVLHIVDAMIDCYNPEDSLVWSVSLPDSLVARLQEGLFDRTRRDTTPTGIAFPNVIVGGRAVGDTVWLLLQGGDDTPAELALLAPDGTWLRRLRVPGATSVSSFAVDTPRRRLYLLDKGEGMLMVASIPH